MFLFNNVVAQFVTLLLKYAKLRLVDYLLHNQRLNFFDNSINFIRASHLKFKKNSSKYAIDIGVSRTM